MRERERQFPPLSHSRPTMVSLYGLPCLSPLFGVSLSPPPLGVRERERPHETRHRGGDRRRESVQRWGIHGHGGKLSPSYRHVSPLPPVLSGRCPWNLSPCPRWDAASGRVRRPGRHDGRGGRLGTGPAPARKSGPGTEGEGPGVPGFRTGRPGPHNEKHPPTGGTQAHAPGGVDVLSPRRGPGLTHGNARDASGRNGNWKFPGSGSWNAWCGCP